MDYLVEFGVEEIPAKACASTRKQLQGSVLNRLLAKYGLVNADSEVYVTPRRIAVIFKGLDVAPDDKFVVGPLVKDSITDGRINETGKKFALSHGISLRKLKKITVKGKTHVAIPKDVKQLLSEKLQDLSTDIVKSLSFQHMMIWEPDGIKFIRPIRWITTVLDTVPVTFTFAGVTASTLSYGARFSGGIKIRIKSPSEYAKTLRTYDVVVSASEREELIKAQISEIEKSKKVKVNVDPNLLAHVVDLVEFPVTIIGDFDKKFLDLPAEIITEVLSHHQKSFSVKKGSKLAPYFVSVINQKRENKEIVEKGYEKIINARLSDAEFYYNADKSKSIEDFKEKTKNIIIHEKIGSVFDITKKLKDSIKQVNKLFGLSATSIKTVEKALDLSLFDLGTQIVSEFNSLQGKIGAIYAAQRKIPKTIADLIEDMTYPRYSGDRLPETKEGVFASFLHKWVMLNEYLKAGFTVKGNYDPVGLRRLAAGIIELIMGKALPFKLDNILGTTDPSYVKSLLETRISTYWKTNGVSQNTINKYLSTLSDDTIVAVTEKVFNIAMLYKENPTWFVDLREVAKRVNNVIEKSGVKPSVKISKSEIKVPETKALYEKLVALTPDFSDVTKYYKEISGLTLGLNKYFESVMVVDKDKKIAAQNISVLDQFRQLVIDLLE